MPKNLSLLKLEKYDQYFVLSILIFFIFFFNIIKTEILMKQLKM